MQNQTNCHPTTTNDQGCNYFQVHYRYRRRESVTVNASATRGGEESTLSASRRDTRACPTDCIISCRRRYPKVRHNSAHPLRDCPGYPATTHPVLQQRSSTPHHIASHLLTLPTDPEVPGRTQPRHIDKSQQRHLSFDEFQYLLIRKMAKVFSYFPFFFLSFYIFLKHTSINPHVCMWFHNWDVLRTDSELSYICTWQYLEGLQPQPLQPSLLGPQRVIYMIRARRVYLCYSTQFLYTTVHANV